MNPIIAKKLAKVVVGLGFSLLLGTTYKFSKKADEAIDDYFDSKTDEDNTPQDN